MSGTESATPEARSASAALAPGLLELEGEGALLGSRCPSCNAAYFPQRQICTRCLAEVETIPLSRRGTVYTYTVVHQAPPGFEVPYALVYVDLPEGVRVLGQLVGAMPEIGVEVELALELFRADADGRDVIGYRFHPLQEGAGLS